MSNAPVTPLRTSQNGWPASADPGAIDIVTVAVPLVHGARHFQAARKAAPALLLFVLWWDQTIEPVTELGSYNYREIRGQEGKGKLSNHASGTALDINQSRHKLGAYGTVPAALRPLISAKAAELGLRWGGDYHGRKDEMHIEVASTLEQWIARLQAAGASALQTVQAAGSSALRWIEASPAARFIDPAILLWRIL